jgi:hypothetical protein
MRNVSGKSYKENQNTFCVQYLPPHHHPENHAVYEITWKNIVEPGGPQFTICNTYGISTTTMDARHALMPYYTYIAC